MDVFEDGRDEAGVAKPGDRVTERADTGEDKFLGFADLHGIGGNDRGVSEFLERLLHASQVAHAVINDDDCRHAMFPTSAQVA